MRKFASIISLLSERQKKYYEEERARFERSYPYLREPAMGDLFAEALLIKIQLAELTEQWFGLMDEPGKQARIEKRQETLRRTLALLFNRMGITYMSKERRQNKVTRKSALDAAAKEGDE